jgi:hypothetical protein
MGEKGSLLSKNCGWFEIFLEEMARLPISIKGKLEEENIVFS